MPTARVTIDELPNKPVPDTDDIIIIQDSGITRRTTVGAVVGIATSTMVTDTVWVDTDEPTDDSIELWYDTDAVDSGTGMTGTTVDTDEDYRVIMFSDGTVRAIPVTATNPAIPTGLARTVRINSVRLTWTAGAGASSYIVYRNGSPYTTVSTTNHRDRNVTIGETYTYAVRSVSSYGLRSAVTATVTAFIDPALNIAPSVEVRTWPATIPVGNTAIVRVNAIDADAQALAAVLGTDVGSLVPTLDPTVWQLSPV